MIAALRTGVVTAALAVAGCAITRTSADLPDLARTWRQAPVTLPALGAADSLSTTMGTAEMTARLARLAGARLPVVVYLHGCTGIGNFDFFRQLADAGFAVVAPDSFARRFRPLQCDPATLTGGRNLFVYDFRLEEVDYALQELWSLPWVDRGRLFLVGTSEGAVAAALYRGDEFRARVIAQWTCSGAPHVAGLAAPLDEPVLAIIGADDPWYAAARAAGTPSDCGPLLAGRPDSQSYVVAAGGGHDVFANRAATAVIVDFLQRQATR